MKISQSDQLLLQTLRSVLPVDSVHLESSDEGMARISVGSTILGAVWVPHGWPQEVRKALGNPGVDLVVAPRLSPASRELAREAGVGWIDATGAAELAKGPIIISRTGTNEPSWQPTGWTKSAIASAEAILSGASATVGATADATGLSTGAVASALSFLTRQELLTATASRGRNAARRVRDWDAFLAAYADAAEAKSQTPTVRVGVLWRDPVDEAARIGTVWTTSGRRWAATGAMAAALLAPYQTEIAPLEMYVEADNATELQLAAEDADLRPIEGGRLVLRPFPLEATAVLSRQRGALVCAPWPRVFVDLRRTGVRGEDAAEHLRETEMSNRR